ncbi:MAG: HDIG domain-containing protein [Bacteroides sp.]|nr:HDIG domain-containing protein [Bacteroides sp.]
MNALSLIDKFYPRENELKHILLTHSRSVADKALALAARHPELGLDLAFVEEAALLHDIGIFLTHAPGIGCTGEYPYICHGFLGADLLRAEGFPRHALVCERHTGAGLSLQDILHRELPLPHRDMLPVSLEEKLVCLADKFFSKTHLEREKTLEQARRSVSKHGEEGARRFDELCAHFL